MSEAEEIIDHIQIAEDAGCDIAAAILRIADAADSLRKSGLTERAIVALIKENNQHLRKTDIHSVLAALPALKSYVRKP